MTAIYLAFAIASEVIATLALKSSEGFTRPLPAAIVVVGYGLSFWLLALVLKHFSVGTTYAIWSAVGTAAIADENSASDEVALSHLTGRLSNPRNAQPPMRTGCVASRPKPFSLAKILGSATSATIARDAQAPAQ